MANSENSNELVKLSKIGNAYALRLSKKDCELLQINDATTFEKIIAADGQTLTFRRVEKIRPDILATANRLMDDHADLMHQLERP